MLLTDQEQHNCLVEILYLTGGQTPHKSIYFQMGKLLTNELALQYSGIGKKGKLPFCQLNLYRAVILATRRRFCNVSEQEINKSTALYLSTAKARLSKTLQLETTCDVGGTSN
ncbi:hypothetical protein FQR65_LT08979 [Abscondita terminalis]|nr:hypothetical protein FQR65_LT08979 [Abscondita terminalis]